jgi:hypothetical protein
MAETKHYPKAARGLRTLSDDVLDGFTIDQLKCRACSGYGNCGYKSMFLKPEGGVVSICMNRRADLEEKRAKGELD